MMTLFTIPKPFKGHSAVIQTNAIRSWRSLACKPEIFIIGDEEGNEQTAAQHGAICHKDVECNEFKTPLVSSAFRIASERASNALLCYLNSDIILFDDFFDALSNIHFKDFVMLGRRTNLDVTELLNFEDHAQVAALRTRVVREGRLEIPVAMDYFAFPRGSRVAELPPFVVGRPGWDNWFVFNARQTIQVPVLDATSCVSVVHQNHGHGHVKGGKGSLWNGPEADYNRALAGRRSLGFYIFDATHTLGSTGIVPANDSRYKKRRVTRTLELWRLAWVVTLFRSGRALLNSAVKLLQNREG